MWWYERVIPKIGHCRMLDYLVKRLSRTSVESIYKRTTMMKMMCFILQDDESHKDVQYYVMCNVISYI